MEPIPLVAQFKRNLNRYRPVRKRVKTREKYIRRCLDFLYFVSKKYNVTELTEINQDHYSDFIRYLRTVKHIKMTTIDKSYKVALKQLAESLNLNFKVRIRRRKQG